MVTIDRSARGVNDLRQTTIPDVAGPRPTALAILTPMDNPDGQVRLDMLGPATWSPPQPRWSEVDRPRRQSVLRYDGKGSAHQTLTVMFSGDVEPATGELSDVTARTVALIRLLGPGPAEPPVLSLAGPLYGIGPDDRWQLESAVAGEPWRRSSDGRVCQVTYELSLVQFLFTDTLVQASLPPSPAAASNARAGTEATAGTTTGTTPAKAGATYTVRAGDTLAKIAAAKLGNASRWRELATLNALRDPNVIRAGQVLKLP